VKTNSSRIFSAKKNLNKKRDYIFAIFFFNQLVLLRSSKSKSRDLFGSLAAGGGGGSLASLGAEAAVHGLVSL